MDDYSFPKASKVTVMADRPLLLVMVGDRKVSIDPQSRAVIPAAECRIDLPWATSM